MTGAGHAKRPRSSLRLNIAANFAGQLYTGLIGIAMVPAYLKWLGPEAFGLIGFFALVHSWAQLLDLGFSASVSRESSRFAGGDMSASGFRRILRGFEYLFWALGMGLALTLVWQAGRIGAEWLQPGHLPTNDVQVSLRLMAIAVAMRWIAGLYRGVLSGVERQVWLNSLTATFVTLRFVVAVPVCMAFGRPIVAFFAFQVFVAALELAWLWHSVYRTVPNDGGAKLAIVWDEIRPAFGFSAWVGVATVVWVFVTQADKLVISAVVPLSEFGFFTAAVNAAGAVSILSVAVTQGLLPRLIQLHAFKDRRQLLGLYRRVTRLSVAAGAALALTLVTMAEPLLWAWTGNRSFGTAYAPVLALYAAGNAFMLLGAFPYSLQHAAGNLRLHVLGNLLLAVIVVPLLLHIASTQGAVGAAWLWLASNAGFFLLWTPLVHRHFAPGVHVPWLLRDVILVAALPCSLAAAAVAGGLPSVAQSRIGAVVLAGSLFAVLLAVGACATGEFCQRVRQYLRGTGDAPTRADSQIL